MFSKNRRYDDTSLQRTADTMIYVLKKSLNNGSCFQKTVDIMIHVFKKLLIY